MKSKVTDLVLPFLWLIMATYHCSIHLVTIEAILAEMPALDATLTLTGEATLYLAPISAICHMHILCYIHQKQPGSTVDVIKQSGNVLM